MNEYGVFILGMPKIINYMGRNGDFPIKEIYLWI